MQLSLKTVSLWSHLNRPEVLRSFLNPLYEPNNRVIWPSVAPMSLVRPLKNTFFYIFKLLIWNFLGFFLFVFTQNLWPAMYLAYVVDPNVYDSSWRDISSICERDKELIREAKKLRRQLMDLERDAISKGLLDGPYSCSTMAAFD